MTERFDSDWLALRERFDHPARSVALARRLADALPERRPRLLDLGAGTGSLFRFLAPIIGRGQDWVLVDADADLLDDAFGRTAAWARRQGFAATSQGDELLVSSRHGLWRMQAVQRDLVARVLSAPLPHGGEVAEQSNAGEGLAPIILDADAVLCSALLDLVSQRWLDRLLDSLHTPFLACLSVDGRDLWLPRHPADAIVRAAFRRDQRRDKGFGLALGVAAPWATLRALTARGFTTVSAPSDWRVPRAALHMQRALIEGAANVTRNATIAAWEATRLRQAMRGRLAIRIGHRDILALPRGG